MFQLLSIEILDGCKYAKNLVPGVYELCSMDEEWGIFWGKGLMVSAIVGKNGSGKSTLLEMLFRIINNLNAYTCSHLNKNNSPAVYFILGVKAVVKFKINGILHELACNDKKMRLSWLNGNNLVEYTFDQNNAEGILHIDLTKRVEIITHLFYTIVLNYSPLAYNEHEFNGDLTTTIDSRWIHNPIIGTDNWIHNLFHKNDGYSVSININPFRKNGSINMNTELVLTRSRLAALLVLEPQKIIEDYHLHSLKYAFGISYFRKKLDHIDFQGNDIDLIDKYSKYLFYNGSCCNILLQILLDRKPLYNNIYRKSACLYICIKALTIFERYPAYERYSHRFGLGLLEKVGTAEQKRLMSDAAKMLKNDRSHITIKLRQAIHFYKSLHNNKILLDIIRGSDITPFDYHQYKSACNDADTDNVSKQMSIMPPPFFDLRIALYHVKDAQKTPILISNMSTGERQFIYSTATIIYHLLNLKSVPSQRDRIHYRNILVVLDEAELSYHPEYQRMYIKRLLDLILRLKLTRALNIHILLTTHSPFMLSDIPSCNILYLQNGNDVGGNMKSPFCSNISDILAQNFFLSENGFVGEFAKTKVLSAFEAMQKSHLKRVRDEWTPESIKKLIKSIGDSIIQQRLYDEYLNSELIERKDVEDEIESLNLRLEHLNKIINK